MGKPPTTCPACGNGFESKRDTAAHMHQKGDNDHPWDSYAEALSALNKRISAGQEGPDNPLLRVPDTEPREVRRCPNCERPVERVGAGMAFEGQYDGEEVTGVTTPETRVCHECDLLMDDDKVVTNV